MDGVFVLFPPIFDPTPGFPEAKAIIAAVTTAIEAAKPPKVVCLSTIGAQATQPNLLRQLGMLEQGLGCRAVIGVLPKGRLVHGECGLGRHAGT